MNWIYRFSTTLLFFDCMLNLLFDFLKLLIIVFFNRSWFSNHIFLIIFLIGWIDHLFLSPLLNLLLFYFWFWNLLFFLTWQNSLLLFFLIFINYFSHISQLCNRLAFRIYLLRIYFFFFWLLDLYWFCFKRYCCRFDVIHSFLFFIGSLNSWLLGLSLLFFIDFFLVFFSFFIWLILFLFILIILLIIFLIILLVILFINFLIIFIISIIVLLLIGFLILWFLSIWFNGILFLSFSNFWLGTSLPFCRLYLSFHFLFFLYDHLHWLFVFDVLCLLLFLVIFFWIFSFTCFFFGRFIIILWFSFTIIAAFLVLDVLLLCFFS